ncbi:succinate dehydrogenase, cytochrome b556 subunit [Oleiphilus messinensis]|uniref:succinate dehydrogenase, cytochrome b556 subunit n=1 Tax=Oleiphilus messinensis TaxID=141451 RepID=UPI000B3B3232
MNNKRPVNLDLSKFQFPLPAITSILHRISGVILFVAIAFLLCALGASLESKESFLALQEALQGFFAKLVLWGILAALLYHMVAGVKHLLMDIGIGETLESGLLGAKVTLVVSIVLTLLAGVIIW